MNDRYVTDEVFTRGDQPKWTLPSATYDGCRFHQLDFSGQDFSGFQFIDCSFEDCNLSGVKLGGASFRDARFQRCKMVGLHFEDCHAIFFDALFTGCILDLSSFFRRKLAGKTFSGCSLKEVDFTEADLEGAGFAGADLRGAVFDQTNLEKADFRGAIGFVIDPERNRLKKAKFDLAGLPGLLEKYDLSIE
jgi:uncharacterized protein YjbI with pentapeptide repeats